VRSELVTSGTLFDDALENGTRCSTCRVGLHALLQEFAQLFAREIDRAVRVASTLIAHLEQI
jgi:hypothetical protein